MSLERLHTLTIIERAARVKETECRHRLVDAMVRETEQRERVEEVARHQQLTDAAMKALCTNEALDMARLALYRDLANAIDLALHHENRVLDERTEHCEVRTRELVRETRYRDGVTQRIDHAAHAHRALIEMREADDRLEAWMLGAKRGIDHA